MKYLHASADIRYLRLLVIVPLILVGLFYFSFAYGATLPQRSLTLSGNQPSAAVTYGLGFDLPSSEIIGSIRLDICANNPIFGEPCTVPAGLDLSNATLSSQSGETGFAISSNTTANTLILTRPPTASTAPRVAYDLAGVINPSAFGTYYGRLQTFASSDASGAENDHGGLAFSINSAVNVSAEVPPYLLFCAGIQITGYDCATATGNYINFGTLAPTVTKSAENQMVIATNGISGYALRVSGTTLTSGNNTIDALTAADVSRPGVGQFGLNLTTNSTPAVGQSVQGAGIGTAAPDYSQSNFFKFVPDDVVASAPNASDYRKFTASYIVNIPKDQAMGVYVTTLSYICLANF